MLLLMSSIKKNIAVICKYALRPDRIGGMDRFYVAFDAAVKNLGHDIEWFFVDVKSFDFYNDLKINSANGNAVEQCFLNKASSNKVKYDVVITHFIELCTPFYKSVKSLGIDKIIAVDHNPRPLNGFPLKKRLKNKLKGILYSKYIDLFVGVSQYTVDNILRDYGSFLNNKTQCIYNGIDTSIYKSQSIKTSDKKRFIVVSHLRESKGIQDLLEAVRLMDSGLRQKFTIDIFGEGPLEDNFKEFTAQNNLSETIKFYGSSSDIPAFLCDYDYLLQPTYMECFSLSILESLSANVPVITTTVGGNPEIIRDGENGYLFSAKDILALSQIMTEIVEGKRAIEEETRNLIEEKYNLELMVQDHLKYIV